MVSIWGCLNEAFTQGLASTGRGTNPGPAVEAEGQEGQSTSY